MNEAETRAEHIDPALKAAGWAVVEGSKILREYPIAPGRIEGQGRRGNPLTADYVLVYRNRKLAVVEAKAWDEELTEGVAQAKNYAGKLAVRYAYSTNGHREAPGLKGGPCPVDGAAAGAPHTAAARPRSAAVVADPAAAPPTAHRIRPNPSLPARPTRCGWCSAHSRAPWVAASPRCLVCREPGALPQVGMTRRPWRRA
jgi:hypothetical protein